MKDEQIAVQLRDFCYYHHFFRIHKNKNEKSYKKYAFVQGYTKL